MFMLCVWHTCVCDARVCRVHYAYVCVLCVHGVWVCVCGLYVSACLHGVYVCICGIYVWRTTMWCGCNMLLWCSLHVMWNLRQQDINRGSYVAEVQLRLY